MRGWGIWFWSRNGAVSRIAKKLCRKAGLTFVEQLPGGTLLNVLFGIKDAGRYGYSDGIVVSGVAGPKPRREAAVVFLEHYGATNGPAAILSYMMAAQPVCAMAITMADYRRFVSEDIRERLAQLNAAA